MSCIRKTFKEDGEEVYGIRVRNTEVMILGDTSTPNRSLMMPFNPFVGEEDDIEPVSSRLSPSRKERSIPSKGASSSVIHTTLCLRVRVVNAKTNLLMKILRQLFKMKRTSRAVDAVLDVHRGFDDTLAPFTFVRDEQNAVK